MEIEEMLRFARAYNRLGTSIQSQLGDIIDGDLSDINPNALQAINREMRGFNDDLDASIDRALAETEPA